MPCLCLQICFRLFWKCPKYAGCTLLLLRLLGIAIGADCWSASNWNELAITTLNAFSVARELWWELELANWNTSSHCQDSYHKKPLLLPSSASKSPLRKPRMTPTITVTSSSVDSFLTIQKHFSLMFAHLSSLALIASLYSKPMAKTKASPLSSPVFAVLDLV